MIRKLSIPAIWLLSIGIDAYSADDAVEKPQAPQLSMEKMAKENIADIEATRSRGARRKVLARIDGKAGNYIEWEAPDTESDDPSIVISAKESEPPMLDPDFAERHSPLHVFLSVAPIDYEVPKPLLDFADRKDLELYRDKGARKLLYKRYMELHKKRFGKKSQALTFFQGLMPAAHAQAPGCSAGQVSFARQTYGKGYGDTETCGQFLGFTQQVGNTFYCTPGQNNGLFACHSATRVQPGRKELFSF